MGGRFQERVIPLGSSAESVGKNRRPSPATWDHGARQRQGLPSLRSAASPPLTLAALRGPENRGRWTNGASGGRSGHPGFDLEDVPGLGAIIQGDVRDDLRREVRQLGWSSIRWFGPWACTPSPRGQPSSPVQQGCFGQDSRDPSRPASPPRSEGALHHESRGGGELAG